MKRKSAVLPAVILILAVFVLAGCGRYVSSYKAVGFIRSNTGGSAFMNFFEFDGTMVFKLKASGKSGARLRYTARLEEGDAAVYYDVSGTKTEWFTVHGGDEVSSSAELPGTGTVYIIVRTNEKCRSGEFSFEISP